MILNASLNVVCLACGWVYGRFDEVCFFPTLYVGRRVELPIGSLRAVDPVHLCDWS